MPYLLLRHKVADYEQWKSAFDAHSLTRQASGSRGGQLFRSDSDPNELVVLLLINNGKWRLKGNLTNYAKTSTGQGAASGTGDLYWWDASLNGGLGDWALAQAGVSYTLNVSDSGSSGRSSADTFGIRIVYTPVAPQPSALPNSTPQLLKGGDIKLS